MIAAMRRLKLFWILIAMVILGGCNLMQATPIPVISATRPYVQIASPVASPDLTPTRAIRTIPTQTAPPETSTPQPTGFLYSCGIASDGYRNHYEVTANLDYAQRTVTVSQRVHYLNVTQVGLNEIVLIVEPNSWEGAFALEQASAQGQPTAYRLSGNRLVIPLSTNLDPGCEIELDLRFTIQIPQIGIGLGAFKGYFGYGERQINLSYWLPMVATRSINDWVVHTSQAIGEQVVTDPADWSVVLTILNAPEGVMIAAPGEVEQQDATRWIITHQDARDVAISISPVFEVAREVTANGITVELYHFADTERLAANGQTVDGAPHALDTSVKAIEQYSSLFGAYPYSRLVVVQGDFPDGMEFSGLVYVSTTWFYDYEGGADNYLTVITVHEVSHQWWYSLVGSDAAITPWLDESLATYSEYMFFEEFYPELKNWWWSFRVAWYNPQGAVDSTVYEFENVRDYIDAVYLRGVQMLQNVRDDIGNEAFFDLLAAYVNAAQGQIATPELFWSLLTEEQLEATAATRAEFLKQP
jgi:hypothetical protein